MCVGLVQQDRTGLDTCEDEDNDDDDEYGDDDKRFEREMLKWKNKDGFETAMAFVFLAIIS